MITSAFTAVARPCGGVTPIDGRTDTGKFIRTRDPLSRDGRPAVPGSMTNSFGGCGSEWTPRTADADGFWPGLNATTIITAAAAARPAIPQYCRPRDRGVPR